MTRAAPWVFALAVFIVHAVSPVRMQTDSRWNVAVALSLLHHGDVTLDEYTEQLARSRHGVTEAGGHLYNDFPLGPSLVALPFLAVSNAVSAVLPFAPFERWRVHALAEADFDESFFDTTEVLLGSMCVALSALLMVLLVRAKASHRATPWVIAMMLAFASPAWSTASRSLWQHGPAMLFLTAALWAMITQKHASLIGFFLACAFVCRPTAAVAVLVFCVAQRRHLHWVLFGALPIAVPWCLFNERIWNALLPPYYLPQRLDSTGSLFAEALAGNLLSAGRGLLVFCPVVLLIFTRRPALLPASILVLHWLVISQFQHWWGGHAFGPRLMTEVTPFWVLLLVPWVDSLFVQRQWRSPRGLVTAALLAVTLFINARGALAKSTWRWNETPVNIDEQPARLWDFTDLEFLR